MNYGTAIQALYPKKNKVDWYGLVYEDSHKYN